MAQVRKYNPRNVYSQNTLNAIDSQKFHPRNKPTIRYGCHMCMMTSPLSDYSDLQAQSVGLKLVLFLFRVIHSTEEKSFLHSPCLTISSFSPRSSISLWSLSDESYVNGSRRCTECKIRLQIWSVNTINLVGHLYSLVPTGPNLFGHF